MQNVLKPYFHYSANDDQAAAFADHLARHTGRVTIEESDLIVPIRGDHAVYDALKTLPDKPIFAVKIPGTDSVAFCGHQGIESGDQLIEAFAHASALSIPNLQADVTFSDGTTKQISAFADINIRSANAQAVNQLCALKG